MLLAGFKENLEKIISNHILNKGYVLFEIKFFYQGQDLNIRLLVDHKNGGINLDECAEINRELITLIDAEKILNEGDYWLDVSSPGLDRPLKEEKDFRRVIGKEIEAYLSHAIEDKLQVNGKIVEVNSQGILVQSKDKNVTLKYQDINKAKLKV